MSSAETLYAAAGAWLIVERTLPAEVLASIRTTAQAVVDAAGPDVNATYIDGFIAGVTVTSTLHQHADPMRTALTVFGLPVPTSTPLASTLPIITAGCLAHMVLNGEVPVTPLLEAEQ